MFSALNNFSRISNIYKLYLIIPLMIPLNFVSVSERVSVSIFTIVFFCFMSIVSLTIIYTILFNNKLILINNTISLLLILFLLFSIAIVPWSINIQSSIAHLVRMGYYTLATLLISAFLTTYWNRNILILTAKVLTIVGLITGMTIITDYFSITSFGTLPGSVWEHPTRAAGIVGKPNFAAGLLAVCLPFFVYFLANDSRSKLSRGFYATGLFVTISGIYFTGSRMGILLVMLCTTGLVIIHRNKLHDKKYVVPTLLSTPIILYTLNIFQSTTIQRFTRLIGFLQGGSGDSSIRTRLDLLITGIDMLSRNPITGVGPGNYVEAIVQYPQFELMTHSHNTYIDVASQTGIVGISLFILLLFFIFCRLIFIRNIEAHAKLSSYCILSYLIVLSYMFFLSNYFNPIFWFVFLPVAMSVENIIRMKNSSMNN